MSGWTTQASNVVVAAIAVGEKFQIWALALVESLRKNGLFQGTICILTDRPGAFHHCNNVSTVLVGPTTDPMQIKAWKARLLSVIASEIVLYLDVDILVGAPLYTLLECAQSVKGNKTLACFDHTSTGGTSRKPYHMGAFIVWKGRSEGVLSRWGAAIESGRFKYDQDAAQAVMVRDELLILPGRFLRFPSEDDLERGRLWPLVHFTFGGRQIRLKDSLIHRYISSHLQLDSVPILPKH